MGIKYNLKSKDARDIVLDSMKKGYICFNDGFYYEGYRAGKISNIWVAERRCGAHLKLGR